MFVPVKHTPLITETHISPKKGCKIIDIHVYNFLKAYPL